MSQAVHEWEVWGGRSTDRGPLIPLVVVYCGGRTIGNVQGTYGKVHRHLFGRSPDADPTDIAILVHSGAYTLTGDGDDGVVNLQKNVPYVLDQNRVTAENGEWLVTRSASMPTDRFDIVIGSHPLFTLQRFEPPDEPGGAGAWVDVIETLSGQQAGLRLRPKPVEGSE